MNQNQTSKKITLYDWRFTVGVVFLILMLLFLITAVILIYTAWFNDNNNLYLGNGIWAIKQYGIKTLLFNWTSLDDKAIYQLDIRHPFQQLQIALIFGIFVSPLCLMQSIFWLLRWWLKTRI